MNKIKDTNKSQIISIIIPTYNRGMLIAEAIKSVINQTYANWELIIVDDGSTDDTEHIVSQFIKKDDRISYVKRPDSKPKGANACRNYGLELSKGDFIKWLDSDDFLNENCLQRQLNEIQKDGEVFANFCYAQFFNVEGDSLQHLDKLWCEKLTTTKITEDLIKAKLKWPILSGLWRRSVFKDDPFNEALKNSQEWLFNIGMSLLPGFKMNVTECRLAYIRTHSDSMSSKVNSNGKYYFYAALGRYFALELVAAYKLPKDLKLVLLRRFFWYQAFSLIKKFPQGFLKLIQYWPRVLYLFLK